MAGLIKATLMLDKGCLVPNINFETPNPDIKWDEHVSNNCASCLLDLIYIFRNFACKQKSKSSILLAN
jgi:hypothetical protein